MVDVIKIYEDLLLIPGEEFCSNIYVLKDGSDCILIDSGSGSNIPLLDELTRELRINFVLLTHGHADHISGMRYISADGYLHRLDLNELSEINSFLPSYSPPENLDPMDFVKERWGEFTLEVIHTPGHTPGSVCFYERKRGLLFSGDTIFSEGIGRTDLPGGSPEDMKRSLELLSSLKYSLLLPGHGPPSRR